MLDHPAGKLRLGGKANFLWHMGGGASGWITRPEFRQIQRAVDEGMAVRRGIGGKHADLAVGDLARRAGVLTRHTTGGLALLEEAGFIKHQHRVRIGQRLQGIIAHDVAQRIRLPTRTTKNGLLAPRSFVTCRFGPRPAGLAPLRPKQAIEERIC